MPPEFAGCDSIRAILLDIEGTTTPIDFVYKTLFPYASAQVCDFVREHAVESEVRADLEALWSQHGADTAAGLKPPERPDSSEAEPAGAAAYAVWLMDRDSKCSALKSLQGKIWREGYDRGELHGEVYPDVPDALARWTQQGKVVAIFSSGSILAQKLLFSSTPGGDLTRFIRAYFDTTSGPKNAPESYLKVAGALAIPPKEIHFISDVTRELDAARAAGMHTTLSVRPGAAESANDDHPVIHSFDEIR